MAKQLHDSVSREVDKFSALPLYQFHYSGVERLGDIVTVDVLYT